MTASGTSSRFSWILDSVSTTHICNNQDTFVSLKTASGTIGSINKDGPCLDVQGTGDINIICSVLGHESRTITLRNVSYCPGAHNNLISESHMDQKGLTIVKRKGKVTIMKPSGNVVMEGNLQNNLYELDCTIVPLTRHKFITSSPITHASSEGVSNANANPSTQSPHSGQAISHTIKESHKQWCAAQERAGIECATEPVKDLEPAPADSENELRRAHTQLYRLFKMKCEDPCWLMGSQLVNNREARTISILHQRYIKTVLDHSNMGSCMAKESPMHHSTILSKRDGLRDEYEAQEAKKWLYRELVGALVRILPISRPNISFVASYLSQYGTNLGRALWYAAQCVFRYLLGTRDLMLHWALTVGKTQLYSPHTLAIADPSPGQCSYSVAQRSCGV